MQTTRQLIEAARQLEADHNSIAEQMLGFLAKHEGKKLTRRILPKLSELLGQEVTLNDYTAGLVYLETDAYRRNRDFCGPGAVRLLIPTALGQTTLPVINCEQIRERNKCYLSAAIERNDRRNAQLATNYPERIDTAAAALQKAQAELKAATEWPCPDSTAINKNAGVYR